MGCSQERNIRPNADSGTAEKIVVSQSDGSLRRQTSLPLPGPPNTRERNFNGVRIVGSGLSDAHVAAILEISRALDSLPYETDAIVHESRIRAYREWTTNTTTLDATNTMEFEFRDGNWKRTSLRGMHGIKFPADATDSGEPSDARADWQCPED